MTKHDQLVQNTKETKVDKMMFEVNQKELTHARARVETLEQELKTQREKLEMQVSEGAMRQNTLKSS